MDKSYKHMSLIELIDEIARVKELLRKNKNPYTQKQNKTYLEKVQKRYWRVASGKE